MPTERTIAHAPCVVIAPDSFKGSLTAGQVAHAIGRGILQAIPDARIHFCPMADGGEGTLDAMLHAGGEIQMVAVRDASGALRQAPVAILPDGTAVIESAEIVGITDMCAMALPVSERSTEGIGDAITLLLDQGVRRFLIALGGSSTNDGGTGMLRALGLKLFDSAGEIREPGPAALRKLERIDASRLDPRLSEATIIGMSDVNNPLCGQFGATATFGPQKGVQADEIEQLDQTLGNFAQILETAMGIRAAEVCGAGAAGGLGYALSMIGGTIKSGAELICRQIELDKYLQQADWVITGEGRSDAQTVQGKAPFIVAQHARALGVPTILVSGAIDPEALPVLTQHFSGCFSIAPGPIPLSRAIEEAEQLAQASAWQLALLWGAANKGHGA